MSLLDLMKLSDALDDDGVIPEEELDEKSNVHFLHFANSDKPVKLFSLDVIISVGYRVKSIQGTRFRQWANQIIKEYLYKDADIRQCTKYNPKHNHYFDSFKFRIIPASIAAVFRIIKHGFYRNALKSNLALFKVPVSIY